MTLRPNIIVFSLLVLTGQTVMAQGNVDFQGELAFGPHDVGVRRMTIPTGSRTIEIHLWYPSDGNGKSMSYADYLNYKGTLEKAELLRDLSLGISGREGAFSEDTLQAILDGKTKAMREVELKTGKYPLLVWSTRYGTVEHQYLVSEYLTSHGFVVAFPEDVPNSPFPWQLQSPEEKAQVLDQHVADITVSITHLNELPYIDASKTGMLAWSYAGESAILAQMDNPDIDLVVGLSGIGFNRGVYLGNDLAQRVDAEALGVPYLIMSEEVGTNGAGRSAPTIFDAMHPASRYIAFKELSHGNFNALEGMFPGVLRTHHVQGWSRGGEVAQIGYETICQITLAFVRSVFDGSNAEPFDMAISSLQRGLSADFLSIQSPAGIE